jgi:uncharacterized protein (TIGR02246 family)
VRAGAFAYAQTIEPWKATKSGSNAMTPDDATRDVIERFNAALNDHDIDAVMALMTPDCVFENTFPAPDGERFEGQQAVRAFWQQLLAGSPQARFTTEEMVTAGDRAVVRWCYAWANGSGAPGHVRGIDLFRVRDGQVAEKLSYVKG